MIDVQANILIVDKGPVFNPLYAYCVFTIGGKNLCSPLFINIQCIGTAYSLSLRKVVMGIMYWYYYGDCQIGFNS